MNLCCKNDLLLYPMEVNRIYDKVRTVNKISSNIPMNFEILSECPP